jgi:hypothetical protein
MKKKVISDLINPETKTTLLTENSDGLITNKTNDNELIAEETDSNELISEETDSNELISEETDSNELISEETDSNELISEETIIEPEPVEEKVLLGFFHEPETMQIEVPVPSISELRSFRRTGR